MSTPSNPAGPSGPVNPAGPPPYGPVPGAGQQPPRPAPPPGQTTPLTAYIKPTLWTLIVVYVVAFVLLNRTPVKINFIFFETSVPLIFVLIGTTIVGAGLGVAATIWRKRRKAKKAGTTQ